MVKILMAWVVFCSAFSAPRSFGEPLRIFYTANRQGEVEVCGCSGKQLGGVDRMGTFLQNERMANLGEASLFADSGDTFFPGNQLNQFRADSEKLAARFIAESYKIMGLDAFTPGERDFAAGLDFLKELETLTGAKFISTNLATAEGKLLFKKFEIFRKGEQRVAVFGLIEENAAAGITGVKVLPAVPALKEAIAEAKKENPTMLVVLSHMGLDPDRDLAALGLVDLILGSHSLDPLVQPIIVGKTAIVQPQVQGQQMGSIRINSRDIKTAKFEITELGKDFAKANEITKGMKSLRQQVRDLAVKAPEAKAPAAPKNGKPFVANSWKCRKCHEAQHDFWQSTNHASAYMVLFAKNQHFDPECIACHSLGFHDDRGFKKIAAPLVLEDKKKKTPVPFVEMIMNDVFAGDTAGALSFREQGDRYAKLKKRYHENVNAKLKSGEIEKLYIGVQCEHCHGNRNGHPDPKVKTLKKVDIESCKTCHREPNAPNFDPAMVKLIACPLMSK